MKEYEDYLKIIKKLESKNYSILKLNIANEMQYQMEENYTKEQIKLIFDSVINAHLKSDSTTIEDLVKCAIRKINVLDSMSIWDLIEESCY